MVLCDTNILIEVYKNNKAIVLFMDKLGYNEIAISDVTLAELYFGARNKKELQILENDLSLLIQLPITNEISEYAVHLVKEYSLSHKLSLPDALIAATALHYNVDLLTLNRKDFHFIANIRFVDI